MSAEDTSFNRLVSLACHDLRTPLATVLGFARTLRRSAELEPPADRYVEMIDAAAGQMTRLLDDLSLATRVEAGRWEPVTAAVPAHELAAAAAGGAEAVVSVEGRGADVEVEREATARSLAAVVTAAARHAGDERFELRVEDTVLSLTPVTPEVAPIVLGTELRDFGSAVAVAVLRALGAEVVHAGETLTVRLPRADGRPGWSAGTPGDSGTPTGP